MGSIPSASDCQYKCFFCAQMFVRLESCQCVDEYFKTWASEALVVTTWLH